MHAARSLALYSSYLLILYMYYGLLPITMVAAISKYECLIEQLPDIFMIHCEKSYIEVGRDITIGTLLEVHITILYTHRV